MKRPRDARAALAAVTALLAIQLASVSSRRVDGRQQHLASVSNEKCLDIVKRVQARGEYTEGLIAGVCSEVSASPKCEFFAEALSLAATRAGFSPSGFCLTIEQAQFCAESMDRLLTSQPVADLAYGECLRAEPAEGEAYCRRFREMLAYAVRNEDLDTMRACYVIQAPNGSSASEAPQGANASVEVPRMRIVASSGEELSSLGRGEAASPRRVVETGIVLQPKAFDYFGNGSSAPPVAREGGIIVAPKPALPPAGQFLAAAVRAAAPTAPLSAARGQGAAAHAVQLQAPSPSDPRPLAAGARPGAALNATGPSTGSPNATATAASGPRTHPNATGPSTGSPNVTATAASGPRTTHNATGPSTGSPNATATVAAGPHTPPNATGPSAGSPNATVTAASGPRTTPNATGNATGPSTVSPNATVTEASGLAPHGQTSAGGPVAVPAAAAAVKGAAAAGCPGGAPAGTPGSPCRGTGAAPHGVDAAAAPSAAVQIVTRAVPLSPLAGHLRLRAALQRVAAPRAKTGLAQQGTGQAGKVRRRRDGRADGRRGGQGEYNGFLSKFVQ